MSEIVADFGIPVTERVAFELIREHNHDEWIDYEKLFNALQLELQAFTMYDKRYVVKGKTNGSVFIQAETGFVPCGWFHL